MSARKKKNKRDKRKKARPLKPSYKPLGLPDNVQLIATPPGVVKMSDVLKEFVEPYWDDCPTEDAMRKLLSVAVIAWNAALYTGKRRSDFIEKMVQAVPPEVRPDMRAVVQELTQRKETYFAENRRMIVDFQFTMQPTGPYLNVVSTLIPV